MAPGQAGPRACSVPNVLRHYRAVISEDLQAAVRQGGPGAAWTGPDSRPLHFIQKNLTGAVASGWRGRVGASCGAQKVWAALPLPPAPPGLPQGPPQHPPFLPQERGILLSIASLGRTLRRVVAGRRRGALERAAWTVALRTDAVMRRHCWVLRQVRGAGPGPSPPTGPLPPGSKEGARGWGPQVLADRPAPVLTAEPVAQEAPSPAAARQPEARAARPGCHRHLLGEAVRAAGGHGGHLASCAPTRARGAWNRPLPRAGLPLGPGPSLVAALLGGPGPAGDAPGAKPGLNKLLLLPSGGLPLARRPWGQRRVAHTCQVPHAQSPTPSPPRLPRPPHPGEGRALRSPPWAAGGGPGRWMTSPAPGQLQAGGALAP